MRVTKTHSWLHCPACQQRMRRGWGRWPFSYWQGVYRQSKLGLSMHGLSTQGVPYYDNNTFTVNATLLSAAKQLKYAGGRAAAALLQVTLADAHAGGSRYPSVGSVAGLTKGSLCSMGRRTCSAWLKCMRSRKRQPCRSAGGLHSEAWLRCKQHPGMRRCMRA